MSAILGRRRHSNKIVNPDFSTSRLIRLIHQTVSNCTVSPFSASGAFCFSTIIEKEINKHTLSFLPIRLLGCRPPPEPTVLVFVLLFAIHDTVLYCARSSHSVPLRFRPFLKKTIKKSLFQVQLHLARRHQKMLSKY